MPPARCAACGGALSGADRFVLVGALVAHSKCEAGIPRSSWVLVAVNQENLRDREHQDRQARSARDTAVLEQAVLREALAAAESGRDRAAFREDQVRRDLAVAERLLVTLRREIDQAGRSQARTAAPPRPSVTPVSYDDAQFAVLGRAALGLAVSRGIYGLAQLITNIVMDSRDDSARRFALLELS